MNIIEFIEDPGLLNDRSLSPAQRMALKSVYGLPLTDSEMALFKLTTGLQEYLAREWLEITFLLGRKSGKSNQITSNMAIYEAVQPHPSLSRGETGICMIVASEAERQSKIIFRYILAKLEGSRILRNLIRKQTGSMIELTNGILIQIFPAHLARVRGAAIIFFAGDEVCFWKHEGVSIDREIFNAVRPAMVEGSKIVKISSPYWMKGECWFDYKNFFGKPNDHVLVFQGKTELFNPSYSRSQLDQARRRDPLAFRNEYEAQFRADLSSMFDPITIDRAVNLDRPLELSYRSEHQYFSFADVAGGSGRDSYAICLGHREGDRVIVDVVRSRAPKFNPDEVTAQYCELLKSYNVRQITGDKFSGDFASSLWMKYGAIKYERSEKTKSELYIESEAIFNTERVSLPNRSSLIDQLKMLVRKARSGGHDSVDSDSGQPEDESNTVCGLIWILSKGDIIRDGVPEPAPNQYPKEEQDAIDPEVRAWLMDEKPKKRKKPDEIDEKEWDVDSMNYADIEKELEKELGKDS